MKTEHKYYVEWTVSDHLHRSEIILGKDIPLTKKFPYIKKHLKEYWEGVTKAGTIVKILKVKYLGTVLRIS